MDVYRQKIDEMYHHGIKGQRWGVRRYQNPDGTLTDAGRKKYLKDWNKYADTAKGYHKVQKKYGIDKIDVPKAADSYKAKTKVLRDINTEVNDKKKYKETSDEFDRLLKKVDPKMSTDELDLSYTQIFLVTKGINPNKFSKEVINAENDYKKALKKEVNRVLGEVGNEPIKNAPQYTISDNVSNVIFNSKHKELGFSILDEGAYIHTGYTSDTELFDKMIKEKNKE